MVATAHAACPLSYVAASALKCAWLTRRLWLPRSEKDAATLCRTIVKVVGHCHSLGVMHR